MGTFIVGMILLAVIISIICKMIKERKSGKGGCGCGCEGCSRKCR